MRSPGFRNASSRSRCASVSNEVLEGFEDLGVGLEADLRPAAVRLAGHRQIAGGRAALVRLLVDLLVAPDLQLERLRERVHHRDAHAVQAARHFVAVVVELAAGVQHRHHDLGRRLAALVHVDGDAAAVVHHRDPVVGVDRDVDLVAVAGERLVDGVVDDLVDEVVQAEGPGRPDVHRGPLPDGLEALQHLDLVSRVVARVRPAGADDVGVRRHAGCFRRIVWLLCRRHGVRIWCRTWNRGCLVVAHQTLMGITT